MPGPRRPCCALAQSVKTHRIDWPSSGRNESLFCEQRKQVLRATDNDRLTDAMKLLESTSRLRQERLEARVVPQVVEIRGITDHVSGIPGCHRSPQKIQRFPRVSKMV